MRKFSCYHRRGVSASSVAKLATMAVLVLAAGLAVNADADTTLGQFTLSNYYIPISPGSATLSDPDNPLSATVSFTYLTAGPSGDNLAVAIENTSTPASSNELIRDVVFQASANGNLLTNPVTSSSAYLATYASEYTSNAANQISPSNPLTYPWSVGSSGTYRDSYDLSSSTTGLNGYTVNADMIGAAPVLMGDATSSVYVYDNQIPALVPVNNDEITFDVKIPNLISSATIQDVYIGYGQTTTVGGRIPLGGYVEIPSSEAVAAPEPSMALTAATLCAGAGLVLRRRRV